MLGSNEGVRSIGGLNVFALGGLDRVLELGLPYGKLVFSTNGFLVSAEKASRTASICFSISGRGQESIVFSNNLI